MTSTAIRPLPRSPLNPFGLEDTHEDADGIRHYDDLPASLIDVLTHWAAATPDVEAVVELGGERLSYAGLLDRASRVAGGLLAVGLEPGDRVALRYAAGVDWVVGFWGTLLAGGIAVAVNTRFAEPEVDYALRIADVRIVLGPTAPLPSGEPYVHAGARPDDVAAIFYTSGTTGHPKAAPTTHHAFLSNAETMVRALDIPRDKSGDLRTLISVPLFHVTGCNSQLLTAAYLGGTSVILPGLDLDAFLAALTSERITFIVTVPAVYNLLVRRLANSPADVSGVSLVGYGGAPIAASLVEALRATFTWARVFNGFGMTETASLISVLPDRDAAEHADSIGFPVPVIDIALDPVGGTDHGELLVRGPNVLAGYWGSADPALTDGWFRTGDVVTVDEEGRIRLVDRVKDLINRGGENVASVEVEAALLGTPGVLEAAVLGVPDEVMGEKVGAVIVPAGDDLDVEKVLSDLGTRLADYKVPQYVAVHTGPLPRNAGGKVLKHRLRDGIHWGLPRR
ncbi:AMP-binding protein [Microbacterium sp. BWT-B31]|uniref:class I adenylate-forming enzyme family protein n=1 Tax=Microbacterium sp. BWT-B31 TaxID=3232072 RepID=UPI0035286B39